MALLCLLTGLATGTGRSETRIDTNTADVITYNMKRHSFSNVSLYTVTLQRTPQLFITCKFCVEDLFVLLPDLFLVVFEQSLTQVAHLLQCKRGLVLS